MRDGQGFLPFRAGVVVEDGGGLFVVLVACCEGWHLVGGDGADEMGVK